MKSVFKRSDDVESFVVEFLSAAETYTTEIVRSAWDGKRTANLIEARKRLLDLIEKEVKQ